MLTFPTSLRVFTKTGPTDGGCSPGAVINADETDVRMLNSSLDTARRRTEAGCVPAIISFP